MPITRSDLKLRLNSEARRLAPRATPGAPSLWTTEFNHQVRVAAERLSREVDWTHAEWDTMRPSGASAAAGTEWVRQQLVTLITDTIRHRTPHSSIEQRLLELAESAAAEWSRHRSSWIPEEVTALVERGVERIVPDIDAGIAVREVVLLHARGIRDHLVGHAAKPPSGASLLQNLDGTILTPQRSTKYREPGDTTRDEQSITTIPPRVKNPLLRWINHPVTWWSLGIWTAFCIVAMLSIESWQEDLGTALSAYVRGAFFAALLPRIIWSMLRVTTTMFQIMLINSGFYNGRTDKNGG